MCWYKTQCFYFSWMKIQVKVMKIKVEERERNACRIRRKLPFSVAKHRGSETRGSEMSVIRLTVLVLWWHNTKQANSWTQCVYSQHGWNNFEKFSKKMFEQNFEKDFGNIVLNMIQITNTDRTELVQKSRDWSTHGVIIK